MHALAVVVALITLAFIAQEIFRFLRLPRVLAYILVGILIGLEPIRSYWYTEADAQILAFLAQVGIVLLFFFSGLEISLKQFMRNLPVSFKVAFFNTAIPLTAGFLFAKYLGLGDYAAAVIGVSLSVSAASFSVDLLAEMNLLQSRLSQMILSVAAISDVLQLIVITLLFAAIRAPLGAAGVGNIFLNFLLFVVIFLGFRQVIAPRIIALAIAEKSHATHLTAALLITLILALVAEWLGFGFLIGAMAGGVLVRHILLSKAVHRPWEEHQLAESVHTFAFSFFVPMFFIWVGFNTRVGDLAQYWWLGLVFAVIATLGNVGGTVIAALLSKKSAGEGLVIGWGVNGKGDVELVVAVLAKELGILSEGPFAALVLMAVISMFLSPVMFQYMLKRCGPELLREHEISAQQSADIEAA